MEAEADILRRIGQQKESREAASIRCHTIIDNPRRHEAEQEQAVREYEVFVEAYRTESHRIHHDMDQQYWLEEGGIESEAAVFDIVTSHKERIMDEWAEPDDIWTMQAELWAGSCAICRVKESRGARHDWRECKFYACDVKAVGEAYAAVVEHSDEWTGREQVGFGGECRGCKRGRIECWVKSEAKECRFEGVVRESVAAVLGAGGWHVRE